MFKESSFVIYSYPLFLGVSLGLFILLTKSFYESEGKKLGLFQKTQILGLVLSAWVGGKLAFFAISSFHKNHLSLNDFNFWMGGGLVFYGSLLMALFYLGLIFLLLRKKNLDLLHSLFLALPFAHGVGRMGCFMAGCCFGKSEHEHLFNFFIRGAWRQPVQLYEAAGLFVIGFLNSKNKIIKNRPILSYLLSYSLLRFFVEFLRGDSIRGKLFIFSTSQWVSLIIFAVVAIFVATKKEVSFKS